MSLSDEYLRERLYTKTFKSQLGGYRVNDLFARHAAQSGTDDPLALIQYIDLKTYLVGDINTKVDRASMAHSLEVREPLMDHPLVEWMAALPSHLKLKGGEGKYIFKKAMEPLLPNDVLYRKKMGFAVPLNAWFRGPLKQKIEQMVQGDTLRATGIFEPRALQEMFHAHASGRRDYSAPLWSLVMFEAFLRKNGLAGVS
jgi:asparagine synthase (glutamine-hydrolysing)